MYLVKTSFVSISKDEEVSELEDLKYESRHEAELDANENILEKLDKLLTLTNGKDVEKSENVEESLKQLHENNPHHHVDQHTDGKEESPATSTEKETKPVKVKCNAALIINPICSNPVNKCWSCNLPLISIFSSQTESTNSFLRLISSKEPLDSITQ